MIEARLDAQGLRPSGIVHSNLIVSQLVEHAVRRGEGQLAEMGPLATVTAPHTGRWESCTPRSRSVTRSLAVATSR